MVGCEPTYLGQSKVNRRNRHFIKGILAALSQRLPFTHFILAVADTTVLNASDAKNLYGSL